MFTPRQQLRCALLGRRDARRVRAQLAPLIGLDAADWSTPATSSSRTMAGREPASVQGRRDGISLWLVLLTTALTPIALYSSWQSVDTKIKEYALLVLEVAIASWR
jgi:hypothetical protein